MENASKALLIAGGILFAMIILVIGINLFMNSKSVSETYQQTVEVTEIQKINSNFTKFLGKSDITAQEIVTAIKYAQKYNEENEANINVNVTSYYDGVNSKWLKPSIKSEINFIEECNNGQITFKCNSITYYNEGIDAGIVKTVTFVKN